MGYHPSPHHHHHPHHQMQPPINPNMVKSAPTLYPPPSQFASDEDEAFFVVSEAEEDPSSGWDSGSTRRRTSLQGTDEEGDGLDMLPQDPALILPDQVAFYAQIKDLLELDSNISLPLPTGWAVGISSSGRRFYVSCATGGGSAGDASRGGNAASRSTTWQHPVIAPRIPLGWERVEMRRGNCVYYRQ